MEHETIMQELLEAAWRHQQHIEHRFQRLERALMGTQADVDADTQALQKVSDDLETARGTLQAEIDNLATNHPGVDLTKLNEVVAKLDPAVESLGALKPTPTEKPAEEPAKEEPPAEKPAEEPPAEPAQ